MNYRVKDIMYIYDLTEDAAWCVYNMMIDTELDMSECSENEYAWCMNYAYDKWRKHALAKQKTFIKEGV